MAMKPKSAVNASDTGDREAFVPIIPEDGLQAVQVGLLVYLGEHRKVPRFAKDSAGKREVDKETSEEKVIWPKEGKDLEQRVAVYVDLLTQTHNYGEKIGEKNIRLPLHPINRGMSEGINFTTVAPRDADGNYIKGRPWTLAPASQWCKIAAATKMEDGSKVSDIMLKAEYKNANHNNIQLLLGKPFMFNVEVKITEKDENKYVNTKLKSPVPLMKGMSVAAALTPAVAINFEDTDLLEAKDELGGVSKFDLIRVADLRKIVLAEDYPGTAMQKAVQEREDESALITKAKEIAAKLIETDKDLIEIRARFPDGNPTARTLAATDAPDKTPQEAKTAAKPSKPAKPQPVVDDGDDDQSPF